MPRASTSKIVFDGKAVASTLDGADGRKEYRVTTKKGVPMPGLALEILGKGRGTWRCIYSVHQDGRRLGRKFKIADAKTELSVVQDRWRLIMTKVEAGGDPVAAEQKMRAVEAEKTRFTFADMVRDHHQAKIQAGVATADERLRALTADALPTIGIIRASFVKPADIEQAVDRVLARGRPVAARELQMNISAAFTWALGRANWRETGLVSNPVEHLALPAPPPARTRKLGDAQLRELWAILDKPDAIINPVTADALRLCLLAARRAGEVIGARREEFELAGDPVWRLPAERSKNRREIVVPLAPVASALVAKRLATSNSALLFSSPRVKGDTPMTAGVLAMALRRLHESGVISGEHVSPHDFRRTAANRCAEALDFDTETIGLFLGHTARGVTAAHYVQSRKLRRVRALAEAWEAHLMEIATGGTGQNDVTHLKRSG